MNMAEVVARYADKVPNKRHGGAVRWKSARVFCNDRAIYSYGTHFPMAYYLGEKDGGPVYLLNGDRYSSSTSGHQSLVRSRCPGFTIPFTALRAAGVQPSDVSLANIVDRTEDVRVELMRTATEIDGKPSYGPWHRVDDRTGEDEFGSPFVAPRVGEIQAYRYPGAGGHSFGNFHAPGAVLLRFRKSILDKFGWRYLLCTSDEGTYCIMELARPAQTIDEAFKRLKPSAVLKAEAAGVEVKRQGEWFFVPCEPIRGRLKNLRQGNLPRQGDRGNLHVVRMIEARTTRGTTIYCIGSVFHRNEWSGRASRQHKTLRLNGWHRAYRNTEVASWQAGGKVD